MGISASEVSIIALSLRVALVSVLCSLPFAPASSPECWRVTISPAKTLFDAVCTCRWVFAARRRRVCAAGAVRQTRSHRQSAQRLVRHRRRLSLDRRRARIRHHGLSARGSVQSACPSPPSTADWRRRRERSEVHAAGYSRRSPCHSRSRASSSAPCCRSRAGLANLALPSRSCRTFPDRPKPFRSPSTPRRRCRARTGTRCDSASFPWSSPCIGVGGLRVADAARRTGTSR